MPTTRSNDDDRPIPVVTTIPATNDNGACRCTGVTGSRTTHTFGQPGCNNG